MRWGEFLLEYSPILDYIDLLGSISRVVYCFPVPVFYQVLLGTRCRKLTLLD